MQTYAIPDAPAEVMTALQGRQHAKTDLDPDLVGSEHFGRETVNSGRVDIEFDPFA